jgi:cytochrome c biogenesis protein CcdA/thiol-disulfide isomerase/thioredoxin
MYSMTLFIVSFIAGVLTVLAPCILPLLPVILGGVTSDVTNRRRPIVIITALSVSVLIFTLLLKGSTALIDVSPTVWSYVSAAILAVFGLTLIFPETWARLILKIPGHSKPDAWLSKGYGHTSSFWTDVLVGAALGPVFTTCSPTFFVILATVLPQNLAMGFIDLLAYVLGLAFVLVLISRIGERIVHKLEWASNPYGWFKKTLGILFILLAASIALGYDKKFEAGILDAGFLDVTKWEESVKDWLEKPKSYSSSPSGSGFQFGAVRFTEIVHPAGFINAEPFKLGDLIGKKVILVDFIDYSCINCERTFPYMKDWYTKYKDQGLEIVAIHTPEFAFEKQKANVEKAIRGFGLTFPIVLDNEYETWNAYRNNSWPHKYLIDIHGNVVYDHIGEGNYEETEEKIVELLNERKHVLGETGTVIQGRAMPAYSVQARSPETYFGAFRNETFGNGRPFTLGKAEFELPETLIRNEFYLKGFWNVESEYIESSASDSQISFIFNAAHMYVVAESPSGHPVSARILIDGAEISKENSPSSVSDGKLIITASTLYELYSSASAGEHRLDIIFSEPGVRAYTFTFG